MKRGLNEESNPSGPNPYLARVFHNRDLLLQCICPFLSYQDQNALFSCNQRMREILKGEQNHPLHLIRDCYDNDRFENWQRYGKKLLALKNIQAAQMIINNVRSVRCMWFFYSKVVSIGWIEGCKLFPALNDVYLKAGIRLGIEKKRGMLMFSLIETIWKPIYLTCADLKEYVYACITAGDAESFRVFYNLFQTRDCRCAGGICSNRISDESLRIYVLRYGRNIGELPIDLSQLSPSEQIERVIINENVDTIKHIFLRFDLKPFHKEICVELKRSKEDVRRMLSELLIDPKNAKGYPKMIIKCLARIQYLSSKKKSNQAA